MRTNRIYYLKKYHSPLITDKKPNTKLIVKIDNGQSVVGYWIDDNGNTYGKMICLSDQFNKIFSKKPIVNKYER